MECPVKTGMKVDVIGIGKGTVTGVHLDSFNVPIVSVKMDNPSDTSDGTYVARLFELRVTQ